jgi:hypothetical protein
VSGSSIPPADWLPVQESLLRGLNHALSNRLSSLHAITMLTEGAEKLDPRMHEALAGDVGKLGELLDLYRSLPSDPASRRDPSQFEAALQRAAALLVHHPECRDVVFAPIEHAGLAEPVSLPGTDALRASILLLLPVARAGGAAGHVATTMRGADGWVHVTARSEAPKSPEALAASTELAALSRFAEAEGGNVKAPPGGDAIELVLPGLGRARGAGGTRR